MTFAETIIKCKVQKENQLAVIPFKVFKKTFEQWPGFENHFEAGTPLINLLKNEFFRPYLNEPDREYDLSLDRLLLVGILLCKGNALRRASVLWDIV